MGVPAGKRYPRGEVPFAVHRLLTLGLEGSPYALEMGPSWKPRGPSAEPEPITWEHCWSWWESSIRSTGDVDWDIAYAGKLVRRDGGPVEQSCLDEALALILALKPPQKPLGNSPGMQWAFLACFYRGVLESRRLLEYWKAQPPLKEPTEDPLFAMEPFKP